MDERQVRALLSEVAGGVRPSTDLEARAQRRYEQRRVRIRAVAAAVVIVVIGSGLVATALVGNKHDATPVVGPTPTTVAPGVATTTVPGAPDLSFLRAVSFVNTRTGFAVAPEGLAHTLIRSNDGGRTWVRVSALDPAYGQVHFENALEGVAWGTGPTESTVDGGVHWKRGVGVQTDTVVGWAGGRLWAERSYDSPPSGTSSPLLVSDDVGRTWRQVASVRYPAPQLFVATTRSTAYFLDPGKGDQGGPMELETTRDGGATWNAVPVPCSGTEDRFLAANDRALLMMCPGQEYRPQQIYVSTDGGRSWAHHVTKAVVSDAHLYQVTGFGSSFYANQRFGTRASDDDGRTWHDMPMASGDSGVRLSPEPGVGNWATIEGGDLPRDTARLWFSGDGLHWEARSR